MPKAIVLLSGGQDSATCLAIAKQSHNEITCVCFDYGQRHRVEIDYSRQLAAMAKSDFKCINVQFMAELSDSALINSDQSIIHQEGELPSTFVPGRNALFLTIAAMIAYQKKSTIIYTGVCQTDFSGYPDCRETFIQLQEQTINAAMGTTIKIETPLMHLTKSDTVLMMASLGRLDWYASTHTCYEGARPACGTCPSCKLRLAGFAQAGIIDPLMYQIMDA
jgi:7-cyano-7-deazaguanine synthase